MGTSGISSPFELLSRSSGQVAYVLLDRSPLGSEPKLLPPLDLHVAGTPLAFALSQDQTLHRKSIPLPIRVGIRDGVKSSPGVRPQGFCPLPSFQGATVLSIADNNIHHTSAICQRFRQDFWGNFFPSRRLSFPPALATQYYTTVFASWKGMPQDFFCGLCGSSMISSKPVAHHLYPRASLYGTPLLYGKGTLLCLAYYKV